MSPPEVARLKSCIIFAALVGTSGLIMAALIYGAARLIGGW